MAHLILPNISREIVQTRDVHKWLMSGRDAPSKSLRKNAEVFEIGEDMFHPNANRGERPVCCFLSFRSFFSFGFLQRGNKSCPWSNVSCSLVAAISEDGSFRRYPGEDGVILKELLVMAFPLHGVGNGKDAAGIGVHHELILDSVALLLPGIKAGLIRGILGTPDRPFRGIHNTGGKGRADFQEPMYGVDPSFRKDQLSAQRLLEDALQEHLPGEDVPLVQAKDGLRQTERGVRLVIEQDEEELGGVRTKHRLSATTGFAKPLLAVGSHVLCAVEGKGEPVQERAELYLGDPDDRWEKIRMFGKIVKVHRAGYLLPLV